MSYSNLQNVRRSERSGRYYVRDDGAIPNEWEMQAADRLFYAVGRRNKSYSVKRREVNAWLDMITFSQYDHPLLSLRETNQGNWSICWYLNDLDEEMYFRIAMSLYLLFP